MTQPTTTRIASIDLLKGLVMVIMALDHVRDYFHYDAFVFDPADPTQSNLMLFFTRWITHFCAPAFSFLAGLSAYMLSKRKTKGELSVFLIKRGFWLVFAELIIIGFGWYFNIHFPVYALSVIWSLGISMLVLAALIHLPTVYFGLISLSLILFHNLLDNLHFPGSVIWSILHEQQFYTLSSQVQMMVVYPLIPWIGVMALGYFIGNAYQSSVDAQKRKVYFTFLGIISIVLFVILRWTNWYGDPHPFKQYSTLAQDLISFFNPSKYPPSLQYLLMTLGASFLFLAYSEKWKGKVVDFFCTFGRVPFFYYILHIYVIHLIALLFAELSGFGWQKMILSTWIGFEPNMQGYGFSLWVVYVIWIALILGLYPLCKKFDQYKLDHKEMWWLSYL